MASKRSPDDPVGAERVLKRERVLSENNVFKDGRNEYEGFSLKNTKGRNDDGQRIQRLERGISAQEMFENFIAKRRPVVLGLPILESGQSMSIKPALLKEIAGDLEVQVERRFTSEENFGQNRSSDRQIVLTMRSLVDKLKGKDGHLLYLSPQDIDDCVFQTPCKQLLEHKMIDETLLWAGNLKLERCNLWMGCSRSGTSSSLHTDYHDNFYVLLQGRKRFRLFSPDCALKMYTYGRIDRVHFNGRISFVGSEVHADGTPVAEETQTSEAFAPLSNQEEEILWEEQHTDDYDDCESELSSHEADFMERPNNFSRVDTRAAQNEIKEKFPDFVECASEVVDLNAGETLFLPAGWFHEVTSTSEENDNFPLHVAINYWYIPPDNLNDFSHPYKKPQ